jgi:ferritin-like metal-binding protein YciE
MSLNAMLDSYIAELKALHTLEKQLQRDLTRAGVNAPLNHAFQNHLDETKAHAQRLQEQLSQPS